MMKSQIVSLLIGWLLLPLSLTAQNKKEALSPVAFEHLHINVADKEVTAKWYVDNVGLEIIPSENKEVIYVADKDHNFMIEFSAIPGIRNRFDDMHLDAFHLAFEGHKTIEAVAEKMLANGATQVGSIYRNKVGDFVLNLRDPDGFASQLIHRVDAFFPKPVKSTIRFEHFAMNTPDQKTSALWFVQFMDLTIPWSKDIDTTQNNFRNYRVPYVGDTGNNMSFELFGKEIDCAIANLPHDVLHVAFSCDQPEKMAARMVHGGARQVGKKQVDNYGSTIINLYDPRGVPIQLIKRKKPIL